MPEEKTIVRGTTGREHKIGSSTEYMPSLTDCNLSTDEDHSICSTSDTGRNGKSVSSIVLIYAVSTILEVSQGCSDVSKWNVEAGV